MNIDLGTGELCLYDNTPIRVSEANGLVVHCLAGTLWITVNGVADDIYLLSGQSYRIPGNGLTLIESIGNGRARLEISAQRRKRSISIRQRIYGGLGTAFVFLPKKIA